jgi:hypothetical protein
MSISTKYKRKLMHEGKAYYWYIAPNYEHPRIWKNFDVLHIVAEDRSLYVDTFLEFMEPMPESVTPALVKQIIIKQLEAKGGSHEI